jgi:hypothetical protein
MKKRTRNKTVEMVEALRQLKRATSIELFKVTGIPTRDISVNLRSLVRDGKFGVYVAAHEPAKYGSPANIWAVDEVAYAQYMEYRAQLAKTNKPPRRKPKPVTAGTVKQEKVQYNRTIPTPITQWRTVWQPSSPYYKEKE